MSNVINLSREDVLKRTQRKREETAVELLGSAMPPDRQEWFVQYLGGETDLSFEEWLNQLPNEGEG